MLRQPSCPPAAHRHLRLVAWRAVIVALLLTTIGALWPPADQPALAAAAPSTLPPSISELEVRGSAHGPFTSSRHVTVWVIALVQDAGPLEISLSNDGATWSPWQPLTGGTPWTLTDGDGVKAVYARVRDQAGVISAPQRGDAMFDQTPPVGSVTAQALAGADAMLRLTATDTLSGVMMMRVGSGSDLSGASWQPYQAAIPWSFSGGPEAFVQFRDRAGNVSAVARSGQAQTGAICTPRPRVNVSTQPVAGGLQVTISATGDGNRLHGVRFDGLNNVAVEAAGRGREQAPFTLTFPESQRPTTTTVILRRIAPGRAATVQLTVTDSCGDWQTFAGGGPHAF